MSTYLQNGSMLAIGFCCRIASHGNGQVSHTCKCAPSTFFIIVLEVKRINGTVLWMCWNIQWNHPKFWYAVNFNGNFVLWTANYFISDHSTKNKFNFFSYVAGYRECSITFPSSSYISHLYVKGKLALPLMFGDFCSFNQIRPYFRVIGSLSQVSGTSGMWGTHI